VTTPDVNTKGLDRVFADVKFPGQDTVYMERDRPQVHFSARRGWLNDPNGLVYDDTEYHLYFQHNPYGWAWGNMHWGHAVSNDLVHWKELPEAIYPVVAANTAGSRPDAAFSGSAFTDPKNTGGFRKNNVDPLLAMYTSTGRGECLKISYDKGRTFIDYEGNPILKHNGRDPKVFWYEKGNHWVMVVWDAGVPKKMGSEEVLVRQHSIYTSNDLKTWTYQSGVEGFFECPELFELPVEGESNTSKWIMYDAHGRYVVGGFDGKKFNVEQSFRQFAYGGGYFYASQTFNNLPGRRVQIGWGRNITQPGMPFNQAMLFPSDLRLKRVDGALVLCPTPIDAIKDLHGKSQVIENKIVTTEAPVSIPVDPKSPIHVIAEFERGNAPITLSVLGYEFRYDNEWEFSTTPLPQKDAQATVPAGPFAAPTASSPVRYVSKGDKLKIEVIADKNILEVFINNGELYYVMEFNGNKTGKIEASIKATRSGGGQQAPARKFIVNKLEVHELNSIWQSRID
jgi:fructan beta-fructosidase